MGVPKHADPTHQDQSSQSVAGVKCEEYDAQKQHHRASTSNLMGTPPPELAVHFHFWPAHRKRPHEASNP
ncbi:hypothetical protein [Bombiscardovia coagulans]|uniref:Uncharacterized protein n=1 Tax=Bombiscardovia coagulans TaxID=686666 RepID=A0A261ESK2_9BIFI|nr:hypothetical protein [Bombiscardovia coagulans]OZG49837.1 hypothetical protein BOCO_0354 [Bombiscardovia coagulans]